MKMSITCAVCGTEYFSYPSTERQVMAIRISDEPAKALADKFGVGASSISRIRSRQTWRHIP